MFRASYSILSAANRRLWPATVARFGGGVGRLESPMQERPWHPTSLIAYQQQSSMYHASTTLLFATGEKTQNFEETWNFKFERLKKYKEEHGDCRVPNRYKKDPQLGRWVDKQRMIYKKGRMVQHRVEKLNSIGFIWDATMDHDLMWNNMFKRLQTYKEEHGHCLVEKRYLDDPRLGHWVSNQRHLYKKDKLANDRIEKLKSIGFVWDAKFSADWIGMTKKLEQYKEEHGDCNVPQKYDKDPQLGIWLAHNQQLYKNGKLLQSRIEKLESIGVVFSK